MTDRKPRLPRLPIAFRIVVVLSIVAGLVIRIALKRWDPSFFLQLVFSMFGLVFTALGGARASRGRSSPKESEAPRDAPPRTVEAPAVDRVLLALVGTAAVIICVVIVTSSMLTVPTIAPMAVALIVLGWAMLLRQFRTVFFVVPLLFLVPIAVWQVYAVRASGERNRFIHAAAADFVRVEMQAPDGSRLVVLDDAERAALATLLARAVPFYPNHEGIRDAWRVRITLRDGTTREIQIGHGSRSRSFGWIAFDTANDFAVNESLESIVARLAPDPVRVGCERMVREACSVAVSCNPGGRVDLLVPDDHGGPGVISFFERGLDECIDSYLRRRCDPGGFACAPGEPVHCVDLDAVRYGSARAALVPLSCAAVFREAR